MIEAFDSQTRNMSRQATVGTLWQIGSRMLAEAGIANAAQETIWLLESALRTTHLAMRIRPEAPIPSEQHGRALDLLVRRAKREPLQYLLGTQEFCGLDFDVTPAVLIPRPETELLVKEIIRFLAAKQVARIIDIGTGSGCLAVALAKAISTAHVYAVDCSEWALDIATRNAERHGVQGRIRFCDGDLLAAVEGLGLEGSVDVVVSNPPYIAEADWLDLQPEVRLYEPRVALIAGENGMAIHRLLVQQAPTYLIPGGLVAMELGQGQADAVCALIRQDSRYCSVRTTQDSVGIQRIVCAERA